jgi:CheY-like chemotaxis protein
VGKPSILVVEDNPLSRATAVDMFKNLGFTVLDAYNGHHALALLEARPEISLMFVDVRMPGMSGLELAKVVHKRCPNIKIILTSGYVGEDVVPSGVNFVPQALANGAGCPSSVRIQTLNAERRINSFDQLCWG